MQKYVWWHHLCAAGFGGLLGGTILPVWGALVGGALMGGWYKVTHEAKE